MSQQKEDVLSRWSRLKRTDTKAPDDQSATEPQTELQVAPADDTTPLADSEEGTEEPSAIDDLPDIETLTYDSDFTAFMRDGVPAAIRNAALKKLWGSDPVLANVDGLNDYDLDYSMTEFIQIATESAEDLLRGKKRKSAHDLRREEREERQNVERQRELARECGPRNRAQADNQNDPPQDSDAAGRSVAAHDGDTEGSHS